MANPTLRFYYSVGADRAVRVTLDGVTREGKVAGVGFTLADPEDLYRLSAGLLRAADAVHGGARSGSVDASSPNGRGPE